MGPYIHGFGYGILYKGLVLAGSCSLRSVLSVPTSLVSGQAKATHQNSLGLEITIIFFSTPSISHAALDLAPDLAQGILVPTPLGYDMPGKPKVFSLLLVFREKDSFSNFGCGRTHCRPG